MRGSALSSSSGFALSVERPLMQRKKEERNMKGKTERKMGLYFSYNWRGNIASGIMRHNIRICNPQIGRSLEIKRTTSSLKNLSLFSAAEFPSHEFM
jgi:hypothetical protein